MVLEPGDKKDLSMNAYVEETNRFWSSREHALNKSFDDSMSVECSRVARRVWKDGILSGHKRSVFAGAVVRYVCGCYEHSYGVSSGVLLKDVASFYGVTEVAVRYTAKVLFVRYGYTV